MAVVVVVEVLVVILSDSSGSGSDSGSGSSGSSSDRNICYHVAHNANNTSESYLCIELGNIRILDTQPIIVLGWWLVATSYRTNMFAGPMNPGAALIEKYLIC